jgi:hypothetical protein
MPAETVTLGERRVDELQDTLRLSLRALTRLEAVERELVVIRQALEKAAESAYNATLFDPAGVRDDG